MIEALISEEEANKKKLNFKRKTAKSAIEEVIGNTKFCKNGNIILEKCFKACTCSGGRIGVFLKDNQGNTISVEIKIDANDQNSQVKRYYNHNTNKTL